MEPCACGRSFVPGVSEYRAHLQTPEHRAWRRANGITQEDYAELIQRPAMFDCRCGDQHWADSTVGRRHWALGFANTLTNSAGPSRPAAALSTSETPGTEVGHTNASASTVRRVA